MPLVNENRSSSITEKVSLSAKAFRDLKEALSAFVKGAATDGANLAFASFTKAFCIAFEASEEATSIANPTKASSDTVPKSVSDVR